MPTLGELVSRLEAQLFVGRERELALFEQWLTVETAPSGILNVSGPSGVGKSALLQAFRRSAEQLGRPVILADAHDFPATPAGLLQALGCEGLDDIQARLNEAQPLIMLDTFEQLGHLTSFLQQELLPRLDSHVKLVIAGRHPLAQVWRQEGPWHTPIRSLPLGGLSPSESRTKLERRGVREAGLVEQILQATGGYPLALSLAADMVVQFGARDFTAAPEWHLVLRTLVERLLDEAADPVLRALLEACAVVRHFDQDLLEIVAGRPDSGPAFRRLCQLSVVRPSEHGLMLHDDVRRILAEDLRWRRPDRHAELRLRALAYYRERTRSASPSEREWLLAERFYLWQDAIGHGALFGQDDPGDLWLDPGRPDDHAEVLRLEAIWLTEIVPTFGTVEWPPDYSREAHFAFMEALLRYPGLRLRIAREPGGRSGSTWSCRSAATRSSCSSAARSRPACCTLATARPSSTRCRPRPRRRTSSSCSTRSTSGSSRRRSRRR
jgi:hypothetical protein